MIHDDREGNTRTHCRDAAPTGIRTTANGSAEAAADGQASTTPPTAEDVFRNHAARVYNIAWRLLGNDADAEDVTQDVLLQVVRKLDTFRGESALTTWLHRVTVNAALALRRKRATRKECQIKDPADRFLIDGPQAQTSSDAATPDRQALGKELHIMIERAIAGLPQIYRDVYVLGDVKDLPNAEIGELLGLSLPAVKSRLHRARVMMRAALAPYFEERKL